ncbi:uncharacterized protein LOC116619003 [Nematostella vectensis]|uniref:uncharacterized protein LOC116619003 n=1 Tax=Nematostella vectensis TaxID=45351 RepID=UPI002076DB11|nr:uncharacterized protein LOC116619003 [Nematostella vectensis]
MLTDEERVETLHAPSCKANCTITHHPLVVALLKVSTGITSGSVDVGLESFKSVVSKHLQEGWCANSNVKDQDENLQFPLLHLACMFGKCSAVDWLINEAEFDPTVKSHRTSTEDETCVSIMLKRLPENVKLLKIKTPLEAIATNILKTLMEKQPNLLCPRHQVSPFFIAAKLMICNNSLTEQHDFYQKLFVHMVDILKAAVVGKKVDPTDAIESLLAGNEDKDVSLHSLSHYSSNEAIFKILMHVVKLFDCKEIKALNNDMTLEDLLLKYCPGNKSKVKELLTMLRNDDCFESNIPLDIGKCPTPLEQNNSKSELPILKSTPTLAADLSKGAKSLACPTREGRIPPDTASPISANEDFGGKPSNLSKKDVTEENRSENVKDTHNSKNATSLDAFDGFFNLADIAAQFINLDHESDSVKSSVADAENAVPSEIESETSSIKFENVAFLNSNITVCDKKPASYCCIHTPGSGLGECNVVNCNFLKSRYLYSVSEVHTPLCEKECSHQHHALTCLVFGASTQNQNHSDEYLKGFQLVVQACIESGLSQDMAVPDKLETLRYPLAHLATLSGSKDVLRTVLSLLPGSAVAPITQENAIHFLCRHVTTAYPEDMADHFKEMLDTLLDSHKRLVLFKDSSYQQTALHFLASSLLEVMENMSKNEHIRLTFQKDMLCECIRIVLVCLRNLASEGDVTLREIYDMVNTSNKSGFKAADLIAEQADDVKVSRVISLLKSFPSSDDADLETSFLDRLKTKEANCKSGTVTLVSWVELQKKHMFEQLSISNQSKSTTTISQSDTMPKLAQVDQEETPRNLSEDATSSTIDVLDITSQVGEAASQKYASDGNPDELCVVHLVGQPHVQTDSPDVPMIADNYLSLQRVEMPHLVIKQEKPETEASFNLNHALSKSKPAMDVPNCANPEACPCQECRQRRLNDITKPVYKDPYRQAMKSRKLREPSPSTTPEILQKEDVVYKTFVGKPSMQSKGCGTTLVIKKRWIDKHKDSKAKRKKQEIKTAREEKKRKKERREERKKKKLERKREKQERKVKEEVSSSLASSHSMETLSCDEDNKLTDDENDDKALENSTFETGEPKLVTWEEVIEEDPNVKIPEHTSLCLENCTFRHCKAVRYLMATNDSNLSTSTKRSISRLEGTKQMLLRKLQQKAENGWDYNSDVPDPLISIRFPIIHLAAIFEKFETLRALLLAGFDPYCKCERAHGGNIIHTMITHGIPAFMCNQRVRSLFNNANYRKKKTMRLFEVLRRCHKESIYRLMVDRDTSGDTPLHCAARRLVACKKDTAIYRQYMSFIEVAVLKVLTSDLKVNGHPDHDLAAPYLFALDKQGKTFMQLLLNSPAADGIYHTILYRYPLPSAAQHLSGFLPRDRFCKCLPVALRKQFNVLPEEVLRKEDEVDDGEEREEDEEGEEGGQDKADQNERQPAQVSQEEPMVVQEEPMIVQKSASNLNDEPMVVDLQAEQEEEEGHLGEEANKAKQEPPRRRTRSQIAKEATGQAQHATAQCMIVTRSSKPCTPHKEKLVSPTSQQESKTKLSLKLESLLKPEGKQSAELIKGQAKKAILGPSGQQTSVVRRSKRQAMKETSPDYVFRRNIKRNRSTAVDSSDMIGVTNTTMTSAVSSTGKAGSTSSAKQVPVAPKNGQKTVSAILPASGKPVSTCATSSTIRGARTTATVTTALSTSGQLKLTFVPVSNMPNAFMVMSATTQGATPPTNGSLSWMGTPVPMIPKVQIPQLNLASGQTLGRHQPPVPTPQGNIQGVTRAVTQTTQAYGRPASVTRDGRRSGRGRAVPNFVSAVKKQLGIVERWRIVDTCGNEAVRSKELSKLRSLNIADHSELKKLEREKAELDAKIEEIRARIDHRKGQMSKLRVMADKRVTWFKRK